MINNRTYQIAQIDLGLSTIFYEANLDIIV